ncbi:DeoR family transcriptional regulator [Spiroplasma clarkii]|uniref:DeoR family transcriptional regulator, fructose operon transcriptional repressor n=1 Tax=Spiroplasma clarkii TaxID=2139 RepID=A0A1Y0L1N7_9MOLU|nr:DeoR/GlpR family DNA-binding transcription regulator [Spiroplasma clarkii]ARU91648.1 DeoR family transcriptional regulator [Spiroplasma clarkii]ATX71041.1 DeoR family transcriptional regulator, fructose operon transcriptional repressor [Spiroplasma clarkii]
MLKEERWKNILDYVNKKGYCTNEELSKVLSIPFTTLRRDLTDLSEINKLERVHGGAKSVKEKSILEEILDYKLTTNVAAKQKIAQKAIFCVKENETIFLDAGSNTYFLAQLITPNLNVRVYTNSIINAQVLANNGVKHIYVLPGRLKLSTQAICGVETLNAISNYNFDVAFIGVNAVDNEYNFYTTNDDEAEIKKKAIRCSQLSFGLADKSKMDSKSFIKFSNKKELALISDEE